MHALRAFQIYKKRIRRTVLSLSDAGFFFIVWKTSFPCDKKRSARMRTRRNGRWLPKQPRTRRKNVPRHIPFYLSHGKLRFHAIKNAPRGCALGAMVDGCRSNRASAQECAKAHSFSLFCNIQKISILQVFSYRSPAGRCTRLGCSERSSILPLREGSADQGSMQT